MGVYGKYFTCTFCIYFSDVFIFSKRRKRNRQTYSRPRITSTYFKSEISREFCYIITSMTNYLKKFILYKLVINSESLLRRESNLCLKKTLRKYTEMEKKLF